MNKETRHDKISLVPAEKEDVTSRGVTYLTVPIALIVAIVSLSAGLEASTKTSSFLSLMAVERPPMGKIPNREKGTEKMVMDELMARMTVSDMVAAWFS
jgi:hypothetical protein